MAAFLGVASPDNGSVVVSGVCLDSRTVRRGDVYAALHGALTHGARFAAQALDAGAVAVLTDPHGADLARSAGIGAPVFVLPDPRSVLGDLSALVYGTDRDHPTLVAITGTNGKTTTAHLVHSALTALGHPAGLIGTVETRVGADHLPSVRTTPEAPEVHALLAVMVERDVDVCVMEVSSHALCLHRVDGIRYDLALFTNLSRDHLDFHGTMEHYFEAKAALFTPLRARQGLVCIDDEWGVRLAGRATIPVQTLTTHPGGHADWVATVDAGDRSRFALRGPGVTLHLASALPGDFNVANTALAAAALVLLGQQPQAVEDAILTDPRVPGRMELVVVGDPDDSDPRVVVDYAHTPDAIGMALRALRPTTSGTLVVVTGAGGDRDRDKRTDMGRAAAQWADVVIVTDDNPRSEDPAVIRAALLAGAAAAAAERPGSVEVHEIADRQAAIRAAVRMAGGPSGTVAVVGKGHESGQEIAGTVLPFDDRICAREALLIARKDQS